MFIVTGHPRSRTAWLSAFLSFGPVMCHHDLMADMSTAQDMISFLQKSSAEIIGVADSGIGVIIQDFLKQAPDTIVVNIGRDRDQAVTSLMKAMDAPPEERRNIEATVDDFAKRRQGIGITVPYEDLNEDSTLVWLADYLTGRKPDKEWVAKMKKLHITCDHILPKYNAPLRLDRAV